SLPRRRIRQGPRNSALLLTAAPAAAHWPGALKLTGTATINGQKVTREIRAATITWPVQQIAPTITRLDREIVLAVRDKPPFTLVATVGKVTAKQGDRITVPIKLERQPKFTTPITITAVALPIGYGMQPVAMASGKDTGAVNLDAQPIHPPGRSTLI